MDMIGGLLAENQRVAAQLITVQGHLETVIPKIDAIDRAVNGQPPGTEQMVDNVQGIKAEQARVASELAGFKDDSVEES